MVVVTWNAVSHVERCVNAIRRHSSGWPYRLRVLDNGSTDGTARWLRRQKDLLVLSNARNLGVTRATNRLLRTTRAEWIVRMGDDTEVTPRWLDRLWYAAEGDRTIGIVGCRGVSPAGQIESSDGIPAPQEWMWSGAFERDLGQRSYRKRAELVAGAVLIRRRVIETIGLYDQRLSDTGEDTDFGLRARLAGFTTFYDGTVSVVHHRLGRRRRFHAARNLSLYVKKWGGYGQFPLPDTDPDDRIHLLAVRWVASGRPARALRCLEERRRGGCAATVLLLKGLALTHLGRISEAESVLQPLARFSARAEYLLGVLASRKGSLDTAGQHLGKGLELAPAFGPAYAALCEIYLRRGESERAQRLAEVGIERCPDYWVVRWALARLHHRQGRSHLARRILLELAPLCSLAGGPTSNGWLYPDL